MHRLIYFIKKTYVAIIFLFLEVIAIHSYVYSSIETQSRFASIGRMLTYASDSFFTSFISYRQLKDENLAYSVKIAELQNQIDILKNSAREEENIDVAEILRNHEYLVAKVVSNSTNHPSNFITISKGYSDGVQEKMSVVTPDGYAVGVVTRCSEHFSVVRSILDVNFNISARLMEDQSIGYIHWTGTDSQEAEFDNVSKYAVVNKGDVVISSGFSHFFPSDIIIGHIKSAELKGEEATYRCKVHLAADLSRLSNVILISDNSKEEASDLEAR